MFTDLFLTILITGPITTAAHLILTYAIAITIGLPIADAIIEYRTHDQRMHDAFVNDYAFCPSFEMADQCPLCDNATLRRTLLNGYRRQYRYTWE